MVSLILFFFYLFGEYLFKKNYYTSVCEILKNQKGDVIHRLPEPKTYEQNLYSQLLKNVYEEQGTKIEELYNKKRDNLDFLTSWVHEVKTPIAVSRLIIENSMGKSQEEILNSLEEEIDKIDNFVEQALYFSRIDAFAKDYFITDVDLERVIKEIIKKHAKIFINKRIKIDIDDISLDVTTDKKWFIFIVNQIIDNALKYTNKGGMIKISSKKNQKEKKLIIEDNGIGIRPEDLGRVFDKGFTGYNGREKYKSTGMGLYLAKRLARKLGHDITLESNYGEYTKVIIHFPNLLDYYNVC